MIEILEKPTVKKAIGYIHKYQPDPIAFQCDILDVKPEYVWDKMIEVAESVRDNQKTCVYAGHSVSKTFEAARLAIWFLLTHKPSTVITTAPTYDQVEKILWKEIHTAKANAKIKLPGKLITTQYDIDPERKWFAYGFATRPDTVTSEATRAQGFHNKWVLIIVDEAAGVLAQIWKAFDSLLTDPNCKILAIGNPTSAQGTFAELEKDPGWHCINISVKDTPNFKEGRQVIPGLSGREYEERIRTKYGEESNEYAIRVLGRKPEFTQGTYLGKWLAKAETAGRIGTISLDSAAPVFTFSDIGDMYSAWIFVQFLKEQIRIVDFYYDCEGKGFPAYAQMLQSKGYNYGGHYSLPDIFEGGSNQKSSHTGDYTVNVARNLGINFQRIELPSKDEQIRISQDIVDFCWFAPAAQECLEGLKDWRKRRNEALSTPDKPEYFNEPVKSWGRHVGDAFAGLAVAYRTMTITGKVLGKITPTLPPRANHSSYTNNVLTRGLRKTA